MQETAFTATSIKAKSGFGPPSRVKNSFSNFLSQTLLLFTAAKEKWRVRVSDSFRNKKCRSVQIQAHFTMNMNKNFSYFLYSDTFRSWKMRLGKEIWTQRALAKWVTRLTWIPFWGRFSKYQVSLRFRARLNLKRALRTAFRIWNKKLERDLRTNGRCWKLLRGAWKVFQTSANVRWHSAKEECLKLTQKAVKICLIQNTRLKNDRLIWLYCRTMHLNALMSFPIQKGIFESWFWQTPSWRIATKNTWLLELSFRNVSTLKCQSVPNFINLRLLSTGSKDLLWSKNPQKPSFWLRSNSTCEIGLLASAIVVQFKKFRKKLNRDKKTGKVCASKIYLFTSNRLMMLQTFKSKVKM